MGNKKGFTLVELTVTFALLAIFIAAGTAVILSVTNIYYQAQGTSFAVQVSEILCNRIAQELEQAENIPFQSTLGAQGEALYVTPEAVEYVDGAGRHAKIEAAGEGDGGYLQITYYTAESGQAQTIRCYDEKAYMGYYIKSLHFEEASEAYYDNVLRAELVLYSSRYGEYRVTNYISCYNFPRDSGGDD